MDKLPNIVIYILKHRSRKQQNCFHNMIPNFLLCCILENLTFVFLSIQLHILPSRQNDITLKQHPAAYFLPDVRKVTWQLLRSGGGGGVCGGGCKDLSEVYILPPTPVLSFSPLLKYHCLFSPPPTGFVLCHLLLRPPLLLFVSPPLFLHL